ncbi:pyruvate formate-lyase-activating protein [Aureibacter tunicatorum]|uniref:Pyruvate formate-lyase-activating enzyme n=1 Tax=Aureibacter tunicatorum TaxID=866807 RepID=A0AAE3XPP3_9BACT|nr:pyruvate formate-lyase-activating protein [Aureibacter tunicatorum]MDR6239828.1 pyruvate formate lyase activating enzyme [Aureibacter tunicatorum]BDD04303.1 pyruvate formate-lyase-activating enzyme [Aureibacter tunicatorum]
MSTTTINNQLRIHSIESFGTHDGPGIRLVIFVQGCEFRCLYCQNPDTFDLKGGKLMDLDEIVKRAVNMKPYFKKEGGVTISGGEPLLQRKVLSELFKKLHAENIHTCLDSNGRLLNDEVKSLLNETDLILLDIKHINNEWHKKLTGLDNISTLKLADYRESTQKPMWLRYVLVPGWSDQEEFLHELGQHFKDYKTIEKIEIQPYHKLGVHKWEKLGLKYELESTLPPSKEEIEKAKKIFSQYFKEVKVN